MPNMMVTTEFTPLKSQGSALSSKFALSLFGMFSPSYELLIFKEWW